MKLVLSILALGLVGRLEFVATAGSAKFAPRSFSVVTKTTSNTDLVGEAEESYSFEQRRAIIDYRLFSSKRSFDLGVNSTAHYFHEQDKTTIIYEDEGKNCQKSEQKSIFQTLTLQPDLAFELFSLGDEFKFISGPARVLLYVTNKLFDINQEPTHNLPNRNVPTISYKYTIGHKIILYATYMKSSIEVQKELLSANEKQDSELILPIDIEIFYPRAGLEPDEEILYQSFRISYRKFEFLDTKTGKEGSNLGDDLELDRFMLNFHPTCREFFRERREIFFQHKQTQNSRFSFKSKTNAINDQNEQVKRSAFVAYDGNLNTMLMERWDTREEDDGHYSKLIYNFNVNRYYHTVKGRKAAKSRTDRTTCIIGRMFALDNQTQISMIDILFGTDKFIYLGLARVRGIQARVYHSAEEYISTPFWLEGGSAFADKSTANSKNSTTNSPRGLAKLKVVLYLAAEDGNPAYKGDKILRIIVSDYNFGLAATGRSHSAALYDFSWNLDFESPKGNKLIDFFSLEDDCSDNEKALGRARIDLLLQPEEKIPTESSLLNHNERNLALLASLQKDSKIPLASISNLETKIITTKASGNQTGPAQAMKASFQLSGHTRDTVNMISVGSGVAFRALNTVEKTKQASFHECFLRAAYRKWDVYFAYNSYSFMCYVDENIAISYKSGPKGIESKLGPFDPSTDEDLMFKIAIYKTSHYNDDSLNDFIDKSIIQDEHLHKFNTFMELRDLAQVKPRKFIINRFNVKLEIPPSSSGGKIQLGKDENKLVGYGFPADSATGALLKPTKIEQKTGEPMETEMTFDQCHSACMQDFKCKSFSVCIRNFATECVLSIVDINLGQLSSQLATSDTTKSFSSNKRIKVKLDNVKKGEIELIKHSTCELYKKNYLELFEFDGRRILRHEVETFAASHIGECAERCAERNLLLVGKNVEQFEKTEQLFKTMSTDLNALKNFYREHEQVNRKLCRNFRYFEQYKLLKLGQEFIGYFEKLVKNLNEFNGKSRTIDGYCIMVDDENRFESKNAPTMAGEISTQSYHFNPEFFYDKMPNYKLLPSKMSKTEREALINVAEKFKHELVEANLNIMESFLARGENIVHVESMPAKHCAARCFFQESTLWPACKSFDVIIEHGATENKVYCNFHTISLKEAQDRNKSELIFHLDESKNDRPDIKMWHFDPRPGLAFESSQLSELAQLEEDRFSLISMSNGGPFGFGVCAMIVIGLIAGVSVGLKYGEPIVALVLPNRRRPSIGQDLMPTDSIL